MARKKIQPRGRASDVFFRIDRQTQILLNLVKAVEGGTMASLVHTLLVKYVMERGLEPQMAGLLAHAEAVDVLKAQWERDYERMVEDRVRKEINKEIETERKQAERDAYTKTQMGE